MADASESTERRTSLVTGANTGIGRVTAHELARRGDRVILACRSEDKTRPVIDEIIADTGNQAVEFLRLDLADLDSVRDAAQALIERDEPIHVLVANAGLAGQRGQTAQGFELAFGVNHLGHFLFVTLLVDLLRASAPARIVIVSSDSHYAPDGIDFDALRQPTSSVTGLSEYGVSKLANVLFGQELARRLPADEVWVASLHPGVIASDVWRRVPWPIRPVMKRFMKSNAEGAETSLLCATADPVPIESGGFLFEGEPREPNEVATPELAAELWEHSERWTTLAPSQR
jgi:retinol dehydrogenase-12